jgi:hypothetical protein
MYLTGACPLRHPPRARLSEIAPELARPRQTAGLTCIQLLTVNSHRRYGEGEIELAKKAASCQTRTGGLGITLA